MAKKTDQVELFANGDRAKSVTYYKAQEGFKIRDPAPEKICGHISACLRNYFRYLRRRWSVGAIHTAIHNNFVYERTSNDLRYRPCSSMSLKVLKTR